MRNRYVHKAKYTGILNASLLMIIRKLETIQQFLSRGLVEETGHSFNKI